VLWRQHTIIYKAFDAYASVGGAGGALADVTRISPHGFKQFCADCQLVSLT
jgi:hypothetical protein